MFLLISRGIGGLCKKKGGGVNRPPAPLSSKCDQFSMFSGFSMFSMHISFPFFLCFGRFSLFSIFNGGVDQSIQGFPGSVGGIFILF